MSELIQPQKPARWYSHPAINILSLLIGLVGILLYVGSIAKREPYFSLEPQRTILVNRELDIGRKLTVTYAGIANPVGDITVVQCYFWNAGASPIHEGDVLEPIKVVLPQGTAILDVAVVRQSRPDIVQFRASPVRTPNGEPTNEAGVFFRILERGDGAAIQLVYSGGPSAAISFTGTIEGSQIDSTSDPFGDPPATETWFGKAFWYSRVGLVGLLVMIVLTVPLFRMMDAFAERNHGGSLWKLWYKKLTAPRFLVMEIVCLALACTLYFVITWTHPYVPPALLGR